MLDYDPASATTKTTNADLIIDYVLAQNFKVQWILETHVHADHMTAAQYLKSKLGGTVAISQKSQLYKKHFRLFIILILRNLMKISPLTICLKIMNISK